MTYRILYIVIILMLFGYLVAGNNGIMQYNKLLKIRDKYKNQSVMLDQKINEIKYEIELLKKDRDYLESIVRQELNVKKPNEDLYIIKNNNSNETVHSNRDN